MKRSILNTLLLGTAAFVLFLLNSFSNVKYPAREESIAEAEDSLVGDAKSFLALQGMVRLSKGDAKAENPSLDSAQVTVQNERESKVLVGLTDKKGRMAFRLPLNRIFTVHITKNGFVEKKIIVDTHVAADPEKSFNFTFDVDIFPKVKGLDVSVLNQPIAKINYRPYTKEFIYDASYTNKVNMQLSKMYRDYFALEKAEADSLSRVSNASKARGGVPASAPRKR